MLVQQQDGAPATGHCDLAAHQLELAVYTMPRKQLKARDSESESRCFWCLGWWARGCSLDELLDHLNASSGTRNEKQGGHREPP
jgi:hypothetical protein